LPQSLDSGRGGKLRKRFFSCALDKEYRDLGTFTDGKWKPGDKILEVRHKGKQAMVAPSTHPSGERVEWLNDLEPTQVAPEDLREQCDKVATVALIARHLPEGGRHELALAYAGFLLRKGLSEDDVLKVLTAVWEYVGAPKQAFRDLEATVSDTAEKLANDEPATGGNTLTQLIPGMIDALCDVWEWEKALTPEEKEEQERQERKRKAEEAWPAAEEVAKDLDILSRYYETMKADGLVGEETNAKLLALIAATRHISKPMSVMVDGPSSGGKSELIKRITKLLPPHFIRELQSMSERALAYVGDMRNQILVVYELGGLGNEGKESLEMMKQLLTEGCIKRQIAESTLQGVRGRLIEVEGPTGLWTTTTKVVTVLI
jgi:hypothetical protein